MLPCIVLFSSRGIFSLVYEYQTETALVGTDQCVVGSLSYLLFLVFYIALDEMQRHVGISSYANYMEIPGYTSKINPKYNTHL